MDHKLNLNAHIDEICKKAGQRMNVLFRIIPYMNITKRRSLLNTFFMSQFNYCPLTWMCHSRAKNNKIKLRHERCLRIIYEEKESTFEQLLEKDSSLYTYNESSFFLQLKCLRLIRVLHRQSLTIYSL